MVARCGFILSLSLLASLSLIAAQATTVLSTPIVVSPTPLRGFIETAAATIAAKRIDTATVLKTSAGATSTPSAFSRLLAEDVTKSQGFIINNATNYKTPCWYPISGNYGLLPRVLFYATIVFALVARTHEWLIAGALAAALSYSGCAAIHASLLVWRGPAAGELDIYPLAAILSTACLVTVPLINWCSTLRYLGKPRMDPNYTMTDVETGNTRTIITYWSILVAVGFLSIFVAIEDSRGILPFAVTLVDYSNLDQIQCTPPNGFLNQSAGQLPEWEELWITSEFIDQNNCVEPCSTQNSPFFGGSLFRSNSDLQALTASQIDRQWEKTDLTSRERHADFFAFIYRNWGLFTLPYIILQGLWATLFGRKTAAQARHKLFDVLTSIHLPGGSVGPFQLAVAKYLSMLAYLWAIVILLICPPILVINVVASEIEIHPLPQSERNNHIGAWEPWAAAALVFLAALVARFHESLVDLIYYTANRVFYEIGHQFHAIERHHEEKDVENAAGPKPSSFSTARPGLFRTITPVPNPEFVAEVRSAIKDLFLDFVDEIKFRLRDAKDVVRHEWILFFSFLKAPNIKPPVRRKLRREETRTEIRKRLEKEDYFYSYGGQLETEVANGAPMADDRRNDSMMSSASSTRRRPKLQPGYLPGGDFVRRAIKHVGLEDQIDIGGEKKDQKPNTGPGVARQVLRARTEAERRRRSMHPLPPVPTNIPNTPATTPNNEKSSRKGSTIVTIAFDDVEPPATSHSEDEVVSPLPHRERNLPQPSPLDLDSRSQLGVLSSIHHSINGRQRRSQAYSPGLWSPARASIVPTPTSYYPSSPPPPTNFSYPTSPHAEAPAHYSHLDPTPEEPLFTDAEMSRLMATPRSRTLANASVRNSGVPEVPRGEGGSRPPSPGVPGRRSTVSYLQVQRPATMMFEEEILLRKDEWGTYHIVERDR